jgi:hypothetical protein
LDTLSPEKVSAPQLDSKLDNLSQEKASTPLLAE